MKKTLIQYIIICFVTTLISCNSDTSDEDILEFSSIHDFSVNNNIVDDIIIKSFLSNSQFNFNPNPQIDTIKAHEQKRIINVGFIGDVNINPGELFDSMKIETLEGNLILLTDKLDTLNWKTEVSTFVDTNKVTYESVLTIK